MKQINLIISSTLVIIGITLTTNLSAHNGQNQLPKEYRLSHNSHDSSEKLELHVNNNKWPECAIELDSSLTQSDFRKFGQETYSFLYFKNVNSPKTIGKWKFEISLTYVLTGKIDDEKPHWNNTFTHPDSTHWLVDESKRLAFPHLNFRLGLSERIDVGGYIIYLPSITNYGFAGLDFRYMAINDTTKKMFLTNRLAYSTLLATDDLNYNILSNEISFGKSIGLFTPYAALGGSIGLMQEKTDKVDLKNEWIPLVSGIVGFEFNYKVINVGAQANFSKLNMYTFKIGCRF
ncbi:MAG: hypothetical protein HJHJAOHD_00310 [Flavobacteriales bacterium]|nr:hypothetical protein [Flavobacteriales bacterium]